MRVEDLRYFEHLAEVLNYTRASKDLEISQPTLSLAIKRLEEEWGVQLFSRNRSTVELTDIGRDISDCVTGALRSLDRARVLAEESLGTENATINLGTIYAMQGKFWSQALFEFREKSPFGEKERGFAGGTEEARNSFLRSCFARLPGNRRLN